MFASPAKPAAPSGAAASPPTRAPIRRCARRAAPDYPPTLFGTIEEPDYFRHSVQPGLGGAIRHGGHLSDTALAAEVGRASVFLFTPCSDEPFGLVTGEAMACGLPVANTDMGAAREIIGEAGIFMRADDCGALAAAIPLAMPIPQARVLRMFTHDLWMDRCEALDAELRASARQ